MTENESIGLLITAFGTIFAFVSAITIPIIKLNSSIVKLNSNFENMRETNSIRDHRVETHEKEIDMLNERQQSTEKVLDHHEMRISNLEEKMKK